jgi:pimeloyl-ACP methyl ester carboxylesterase
MDARGCGASDKPHEREAYRLDPRVADVITILDDLGLSKAHFHGYSMGGYIGWGIARYASERLLSLIIGGSGPNMETRDESEVGPGPIQKALRQGIDAYLAFCKAVFGPWWQPQWEAKILASDMEALIAMASRWETHDPDRILPSLAVPCLIFAGEQDNAHSRAKEASEIIPNATFLSLPDLDHVEATCQIDLVLPHMRKFLAEVG